MGLPMIDTAPNSNPGPFANGISWVYRSSGENAMGRIWLWLWVSYSDYSDLICVGYVILNKQP